MNTSHLTFTIKDCKVQATHLLKALSSLDFQKSQQAARRFLQLPEFAKARISDLTSGKIAVKRKHALNVVAIEKGFKSWSQLKCQLPFIKEGHLNDWFETYDEAKAYQKIRGGYLIPFQNHYFVCDGDYINKIGLRDDDPLWERMGYDWARPKDYQAFRKLYRKWVYASRDERGSSWIFDFFEGIFYGLDFLGFLLSII